MTIKSAITACLMLLVFAGANCRTSSIPDTTESTMPDVEMLPWTEVTDAPSLLAHAKAVENIKQADLIRSILADVPDFFDETHIYTTTSVTTLGSSKFWFPLNPTFYAFYEANPDLPVWQVLISCTGSCDLEAFLRVLNAHSPAIPDQGVHPDSRDVVFVVSAQDGAILMQGRGPGSDPGHPTFRQQWSLFE